jgi:hypothetical protein
MKIEYLPETDTSYGVMSCNWLSGTLFEPTYIKKQPKMVDTVIMIHEFIQNTSYVSDTIDTINTTDTTPDGNDRV